LAILFCVLCYHNWPLPVPEKINWEDHISKNSAEWGWQMAVCKMFDERPVWPRQSLYECLIDDGLQISQSQFKRSHYSFLFVQFHHYFGYAFPSDMFFIHSFSWVCFVYLLRLLFRAGYYFSTGPFGKFWIRRGYDPRKDPDSRM
jgi:general transcription factor 3C polypeptide 5 (transcription factor C subunit 1)